MDSDRIFCKFLNEIPDDPNTKENISGYVEGTERFEQLLTELKAVGCSFYTRTSETPKGNKIFFSSARGDVYIPFFGSPFKMNKVIHYACIKGMATRRPQVKKMDSCDPIKRRRVKKSKKLTCPAKMTVKVVDVFIKHKLENDSRKLKKKILCQLGETLDKRGTASVQSVKRYYLSVTPWEKHNHNAVAPTPTVSAENYSPSAISGRVSNGVDPSSVLKGGTVSNTLGNCACPNSDVPVEENVSQDVSVTVCDVHKAASYGGPSSNVVANDSVELSSNDISDSSGIPIDLRIRRLQELCQKEAKYLIGLMSSVRSEDVLNEIICFLKGCTSKATGAICQDGETEQFFNNG